jgi:hypothetical protein
LSGNHDFDREERMNMKILLAVLVLFVSACVSGIRYSPEEIAVFSPEAQEHIKKGEIAPGMSQAAVRYAWGAPDEVVTLEPAQDGGKREQWVYKDFGARTKLVFVGGKLTDIATRGPVKVKEAEPLKKP